MTPDDSAGGLFSSRSCCPVKPGGNAPSDALCHQHPRRRPGRRRRGGDARILLKNGIYQQHDIRSLGRWRGSAGSSWMPMQYWIPVVLLALLLGCGGVEASLGHDHVGRLERRTELVFDMSEPPMPNVGRLIRRDGIQIDGQPSGFSLPQPFDTTLGNNFTSPRCPRFFTEFLSNQTFIDCLPFSLLLQTSTSFFSTCRSPLELTHTLTATCSVPFPQCSRLMSTLATQLLSPSTCGPDYSLQNPTVTQAYAGLTAYQPLYHAGCLRSPTNGDYCFANAVTNASASPSSTYIYYLPLGVALPPGTQPSCDGCLKRTMEIFAAYAGNGSQVLSEVYAPAAREVDVSCGEAFVEADVKVTSSAARASGRSRWMVILLGMFVAVWVGFL